MSTGTMSYTTGSRAHYDTMNRTWKNQRPTRYRIQVDRIAVRKNMTGTFERYFSCNGSQRDMRFILKLARNVEAKMIEKYGSDRVHLQFLDEDGQWEDL